MTTGNIRNEGLSLVTIAEAIAEAWNREGINYAVVHGLEQYPGSLGRDLDIIVNLNQLQQALQIASSVWREMMRCSVIVHAKPWACWCFAFKRTSTGLEVLEMDLIPQLQWGPALLVGSPHPTHNNGPFKIDPWASFVKRILIQVLGGHLHRLRDRPHELVMNPWERDIVASRLEKYFGDCLARKLFAAIEKQNVDHLTYLLPRLRRKIVARVLTRNPFEAIKGSVTWLRNEIALSLFPRPVAPIVALVGPDGVGKSTVIEELKHQAQAHFTFTGIQIRHWRPGLLPPLRQLLGRSVESQITSVPPRRTPGRFSLARLAYYTSDFFLGSWWKDKRASALLQLVLYDRCALDMVVDPVRYGLSSARCTKFLWKFIPKPDLTILLYDTPERIVARKPELPRKEVKQQLKEWLQLAEEGKVDAIIRVDADPKEIAHRVKDLIVEAFITKNGGDISAKTSPEETLEWLYSILNPCAEQFDFNLVKECKKTAQYINSGFGFLSIPGGRGYLISLDSCKAAVQGLSLYNAQSLKARLGKRLLRVGIQLSLGHLILPKWQPGSVCDMPANTDNPSLLVHLREVFQSSDLTFSVSLGAPGVHRKPVLQVLTRNGRILGYAKVGWNEATCALVRHEAEVLRKLNGVSLSFQVPRIACAGEWQGMFICVQSPPDSKENHAPQRLTQEYLDVLKELAALLAKRLAVEESVFWERLLKRVGQVQNTYFRHVLEEGIRIIREELGNQPMPFHWCHGDFVPWNAYCADRKIFLFDWEYANPEAPGGYDLFHFLVQTLWLLQKKTPGTILQIVMRTMTEPLAQSYWNYLGIEENILLPLFLLYLLDRLAFYASEEPGNFHRLQRLSLLVNLCMDELKR